MGALFRVIWQIALLRKGPQVLPASSVLLALVLGAHWLTGVVLGLSALPLDAAMLSALVGTLVMVAVVHGLLLLHSHPYRVQQTLTAMAACETMIGLMGIPVLSWFNMGGGLQDIAVLLWLGLFGWSIAFAAHILRHALSVSPGMGFLFAVGYTLVAISVGDLVVPSAG